MKNELSIYETFAPLATMSKKEIKDIAKKQGVYIKDLGESERAFAFLKKISELINEAQSEIKDDAITLIERGSNYFHGVKMSVQSKTTYSYENDKEWSELNTKLKERETFLKGLKHPIEVLNKETGEVETIYPPTFKKSDYIKAEF